MIALFVWVLSIGAAVVAIVFIWVGIAQKRVLLFQPKIRVYIGRSDRFYDESVGVWIKNGSAKTLYKGFQIGAEDFDARLREAISEARVLASGMRDAERHARRRLPA